MTTVGTGEAAATAQPDARYADGTNGRPHFYRTTGKLLFRLASDGLSQEPQTIIEAIGGTISISTTLSCWCAFNRHNFPPV